MWVTWAFHPFSSIFPNPNMSSNVISVFFIVLLWFHSSLGSLTSASDSSLHRNLSRTVDFLFMPILWSCFTNPLTYFDHVRYGKLCAMWSYVRLREAIWSWFVFYVFLNMRQRQFIVHLYELLSCHRSLPKWSLSPDVPSDCNTVWKLDFATSWRTVLEHTV